MRVLVCGGRNYPDKKVVWNYLDSLHTDLSPLKLVIHGGATGADLMAMEWAIANGVDHHAYRPDWGAYGDAAGPIRNRHMLRGGKPDLVVAFPGDVGTADMVRQAIAAKVPVEYRK